MPGSGPWKEGRVGAASLCYVALDPTELLRVAAPHARVGIRATVACHQVVPPLSELAARNWDLARAPDAAPETFDGPTRRVRLLASDDAPGERLEQDLLLVADRPGSIPHPYPDLREPVPSQPAPQTVDALIDGIEAVVLAGAWAIWRIDGPRLGAWSDAELDRLLSWLGQHHARIWCAPIRDIATWR